MDLRYFDLKDVRLPGFRWSFFGVGVRVSLSPPDWLYLPSDNSLLVQQPQRVKKQNNEWKESVNSQFDPGNCSANDPEQHKRK